MSDAEQSQEFTDSDGRKCNLVTMCRREPEWAAAQIAFQRKQFLALEVERDEARAEVERLNKQLDINAAAHRRDVERKDEALTAETYAWSQVRAMRNEMASFDDRACEWGAELGKAMKQLSEAHETIERLKEANKKLAKRTPNEHLRGTPHAD